MFTGIVTDIGEIVAAETRGDVRFVVRTGFDTGTLAIGASVACAGCCLTIVAKTTTTFSVDVSAETLSKTTLGKWRTGTRINLQRPAESGG